MLVLFMLGCNLFPGALLKARNDGSLFPKIDFCVEGKFTSFGVDEAGQQILGHVYLFPRGIHLTLKWFYLPIIYIGRVGI